jgi:hypothetical protein
MSQNEGQAWLGFDTLNPQRGRNLGGEVGQFVESRRIRQSLVRDQRPAQFKEYEFIHKVIFA